MAQSVTGDRRLPPSYQTMPISLAVSSQTQTGSSPIFEFPPTSFPINHRHETVEGGRNGAKLAVLHPDGTVPDVRLL